MTASSVRGSGLAAAKRRNASSISALVHCGSAPCRCLGVGLAPRLGGLSRAALPLRAAFRRCPVDGLDFFLSVLRAICFCTPFSYNERHEHRQQQPPRHPPTRKFFRPSSRRTARSARRGFLIFMLCLGGLSFVSGVVFVAIGAWPVCGFFGLDVLLVYWRSAPITAPRAPTRKSPSPPRNSPCARSAIAAACANGRSIRCGCGSTASCTRNSASSGCSWCRAAAGCRSPRFSAPHEKESFALALSNALGEAKRGPTRTVFE